MERWPDASISEQALDASPDPQLILAPNGRIAYANTAFDDLFPQTDRPALSRIATALADADAMPDFDRLRSRAAGRARAIAALPLRDSRARRSAGSISP